MDYCVENVENHLFKHFGPLPNEFNSQGWACAEFDFDPGTNTREFLFNALQYKRALFDGMRNIHQIVGNCDPQRFTCYRNTDTVVFKCNPDDSTEFYFHIHKVTVYRHDVNYSLSYTISLMTPMQGTLETIEMVEWVNPDSLRGKDISKYYYGERNPARAFSWDVIVSQISNFGLPVYRNLRYKMDYTSWTEVMSGKWKRATCHPEYYTMPYRINEGELTLDRVIECVENYDDMTLTLAGCSQFCTLMFIMHGIFETTYNIDSTYMQRLLHIERIMDYLK